MDAGNTMDSYHDEPDVDEDNSGSEEEEEDEDNEDDVRLKAFALLNRLGKDKDDDDTMWPEKPQPQPRLSSYQRNQEMRAQTEELRRSQAHYAQSQYEEWGVAGMFLGCITDACKKSTEYAVKVGYETIYPDSRAAVGDFEKVTILPTYGYGNIPNVNNEAGGGGGGGQSSGER